MNYDVNSHVYDPGHSLIDNNFKVVSIVKRTFKEWSGTMQYFFETILVLVPLNGIQH